MRKRTWSVFGLFGVFVAVAALSPAEQEVSRVKDMFRGEKNAYALWPAELVSGSDVVWAEWSPSGKTILATRKNSELTPDLVRSRMLDLHLDVEPATETTLFLWSPEDRKTRVVWQTSASADVGLYHWIGRSEVALALIRGQSAQIDGSIAKTQALMLIDAAKTRARIVAEGVEDGQGTSIVDVQASPTMPYAVELLRSTSPEAKRVAGADGLWSAAIIGSDGKVGNPIALPAGATAYLAYRIQGSARGYLRGWGHPKPEPGQKPGVVFTWYSIDEASGSIAQCPPPKDAVIMEDYSVAQNAPEPRVRIDRISVGTGSAARNIDSAWLYADGVPEKKGRRSAVLVAPDCAGAAINSKLDKVLYLAGGFLYVRKLQVLSLEEFEAAADIEERRTVIANAKQIATALMVFAGDNDDILPGKEGLGDLLFPYLKDGGLTTGFVYTFDGGLVTNVEDPANTQMGYIDGPGGRAVVYVDGHVKWQAGGG